MDINFYFSRIKCPGIQLLGCMVSACFFLFFKKLKLFPAWLYNLTFPPATNERSSFSASWLPFQIVTVYFSCPNRWVVILQHSLNLHFPSMWYWNIFFMCIFAIYISLVACLFMSFAYFFNWIFGFLLLHFGSF